MTKLDIHCRDSDGNGPDDNDYALRVRIEQRDLARLKGDLDLAQFHDDAIRRIITQRKAGS